MDHDSQYSIDIKANRHGSRGNLGRGVIGILGAFCTLIASTVQADSELPQFDNNQHVGVISCSSSTCHGSLEPRDTSNVLQNEFFIWHRHDPHARAWEALNSDRARRIADRLGIESPERAGTCLDCHADNVEPEHRGPRFRISDGVSCEACHGGAGKWLRSHADSEATHADNLAEGLYPTEDPAARARLCMSCHYSHPESPMTHRLMSAGHPPLLFDLDVFTRIQPAHFRVDGDYRERKGNTSSAGAWLAGELASAGVQLETLANRFDEEKRLFPDFHHFDCASCHRDFREDEPARMIEGLEPGDLRLEDASLRLAGHVAAAVDPDLGTRWSRQLAALHAATRESAAATREAAQRLRALAERIGDRLGDRSLDGRTGARIMQRIVDSGLRSDFADRSWAEQSVMALASLLEVAAEQEWYGNERQARLDDALGGLYAALEGGTYSPGGYREALRGFSRALGQG